MFTALKLNNAQTLLPNEHSIDTFQCFQWRSLGFNYQITQQKKKKKREAEREKKKCSLTTSTKNLKP